MPGGLRLTSRKLGVRASLGAGAIGALLALSGCDASPSEPDDSFARREDRFHEKSFSWDDPAATPALAKAAARRTRFATADEWGRALRALDDSLRDPAFSDGLWKPLDRACDGLTLALWNVHGTVSVGDSVVLDESILKSRCADIADEPRLAKAAAAQAVHPAADAEHRVYPYKMIGRSWDNYDLVVYKSTGSETQFKKHREKLFVTAWWDTDAARIGVRAYLLNCGVTVSGAVATRTCVSGGLRTAAARDHDYVVQRDFSAGIKLVQAFPEKILPSPTLMKVSDAVIGLHSVDHAGIAFRASSSSGLTPATRLALMPPLEYVTW
jgi:hypothetical protein